MPAPFVSLYFELSETSRSEEKIALLVNYLRNAPADEFGLAVHLLRGGRYRGAIRSALLREWAGEVSGTPAWLLEESYGVVGDLAETVALLVSSSGLKSTAKEAQTSLISWVRLLDSLAGKDITEQKTAITHVWSCLTRDEILVFNKLVTGGLRIGVSKGTVAKALSRLVGRSSEEVSLRLMGKVDPKDLTLEALSAPLDTAQSVVPYPFFLAHPLDRDTIECGGCSEYQIEWKWDGVRAQLVKRGGRCAVWSRGEELFSETFPELVNAVEALPDGTVLDGEIVAWDNDKPGGFFALQKRINRKNVTKAIIQEMPIRYLVYDLLEYGGMDLRTYPLAARTARLQEHARTLICDSPCMAIPQPLGVRSWDEVKQFHAQSREHQAEGLMLKRLDSPYGVGRTAKGAWWKWKVDPFSVDAVLLYAQKGHGRRADLYTDYTFGVWDGDKLVTFAKAYSGLTDAEIAAVDTFIKRNTKERFGPVRTVNPELVFEIAFESIQPSTRHRSGVAVRFPRIIRWRKDKSAAEADTVETLRGLTGI
jgi:DNA ligase-1